jgi:hypothetical protein
MKQLLYTRTPCFDEPKQCNVAFARGARETNRSKFTHESRTYRYMRESSNFPLRDDRVLGTCFQKDG